MHWRGLSDIPSGWPGSVVTVGAFDGLHRGHLELITRTRARADDLQLPAVAVTFDPHPLAVLRGQAPPLLAPVERRVELLREAGMTAVLVLAFDHDLAAWSPERFAGDVLVDGLAAKAVVVGADFRFGARAAGTVETLAELGTEAGFVVEAVPLVLDGAADARVSSSRIRAELAAGRVAEAGELLGRPYRLSGVVVAGDKRGRSLGYPTANLAYPQDQVIPADGVYAGWISVPGEVLPAAISIGTNPTFSGRERRVEAYALDRDDLELYGCTIALDFMAYLRPTLKFDAVPELLEQMAKDVEATRQLTVRI